MATVKITVRPNGPYRVEAPEGSIELVDAQGNKYDLTGKPAFSLCRCGGSVNKPFCDGTHSKVGFQGAELAVKKAEEPVSIERPHFKVGFACILARGHLGLASCTMHTAMEAPGTESLDVSCIACNRQGVLRGAV